MTPEELTELYRTFQHSAWRLEARDDYAVPGEDADFDDFLAGRPVAARTVENSWWLATVANACASNRYFGRVRLVGHPITDYTRFEFASYPENISAGEEVQVLDREWLEPGDFGWTHQDFWLFDDTIAILQHYDPAGRFLGVERAPDAAPFVEIKRHAMRLSVPFQEFQLVPGARRPPMERSPTTRASAVDN